MDGSIDLLSIKRKKRGVKQHEITLFTPLPLKYPQGVL